MKRHSAAEMIEAIRAVASLPGAEPHRDALLDTVRLIASATVAASDLRRQAETGRNQLVEDAGA